MRSRCWTSIRSWISDVRLNATPICVGGTDADPQRNERPRGGRSGSSRKREELGYDSYWGLFRRSWKSSFGGRRALGGHGATRVADLWSTTPDERRRVTAQVRRVHLRRRKWIPAEQTLVPKDEVLAPGQVAGCAGEPVPCSGGSEQLRRRPKKPRRLTTPTAQQRPQQRQGHVLPTTILRSLSQRQRRTTTTEKQDISTPRNYRTFLFSLDTGRRTNTRPQRNMLQ